MVERLKSRINIKMYFDLIIVGGGASGIIAALSAKQQYPAKNIAILEKQSLLLRKVRASGNGRCNISNAHITPQAYFSVGSSEKVKNRLLKTAFSEFSASETKDLCTSLGIYLREDEAGRIYPYAEQAEIVVDALIKALEYQKINILTEYCVQKIAVQEDDLIKIQVEHTGQMFEFTCRNLILACGSYAASPLGGTKLGYDLLKQLQITVTPLYCALAPLTLKYYKERKILAGQRFKGRASLLKNKQLIQQTEGEFLFTKEGISGIAAMELARFVENPQTDHYQLRIDFVPELSEQEIKILLDKISLERGQNLCRRIPFMFVKKVIALYLQKKAKDIKQMIHLLKDCPFEILDVFPAEKAQVIAGGALLDEIYFPEMALKSNPNIYICGELLDVDGRTGGFNLQWAITSGFLAGKLKRRY